jgi:hypothetical protein
LESMELSPKNKTIEKAPLFMGLPMTFGIFLTSRLVKLVMEARCYHLQTVAGRPARSRLGLPPSAGRSHVSSQLCSDTCAPHTKTVTPQFLGQFERLDTCQLRRLLTAASQRGMWGYGGSRGVGSPAGGEVDKLPSRPRPSQPDLLLDFSTACLEAPETHQKL